MKNILIISKNNNLKTEFEKTGLFKNITTCQFLENKIKEGIDILIADNSAISYKLYIQNLQEFLKLAPSNYFIADSADTYASINKVLTSYGIIVIAPYLSDAQICQKICSMAVDNYSSFKNIICFFGAGPGAGTSMVSLSVAQVMSEISSSHTCLLNLDGGYGDDYVDSASDGMGLAQIKERLINNILSEEELKNSCIKSSYLYFLPGEKEISKVRHYHPEHIEKLTKLAAKTFDITIINAGSNITGMSIGALNSSDIKLLVATQSQKYFTNFSSTVSQVFSNLGISFQDFLLVINKYIEYDGLENEIVLSKKYGMQLASVIALLEYIPALEAEIKKKTLLSFNKAFTNSIKQLSVSLLKQLAIEMPGDKTGKKMGIFKKRL
ncbi:MAG: P-loop NTPase family protein [Candidatus Humimicrobiaceae bacterium]